MLKNKIHPNVKLSRSFQKHGLEAFLCATKLVCDDKNLLMYEQLLINFYDSAVNGYNVNKKAERGFTKKLEPLSEEFFAKRSEVRPNGCWFAIGGASGSGDVPVKRGGKPIGIHRLAYEFYIGKIPEGKRVIRSCKNKRCINPDHLILSSTSDIAKNTFATGRKHPRGNTILNETTVKEIKMSNEPMLRLAKKYGVSDATIRKIKHGETWNHVCIANEDAEPLMPFSIDPQPYPMRVWG